MEKKKPKPKKRKPIIKQLPSDKKIKEIQREILSWY